MKHAYFFSLTVMLLASCKSYSPAPIDWNAEWETWQSVGTNQVVLSRESVRALALIGNPELSMLRLKCSISSNAVLQSGWWEDPEIGFDAMRILANGTGFPWVLGSAVTLTVPVSGVKGLEKKVAEAYSEADRWMLLDAELRAMAEAEMLLSRLITSERRLCNANWAVSDLTEFYDIVKKLADTGEVEISQFHEVKQRLAEAQIVQREAETRHSITSEELLAFLGFPPKTPWVEGYYECNIDAEGIEPETLIRHPRVMAKFAKLNVSEAELKLEIRRQYPDLVIGSAIGREDGKNRAGLVAGISLPLWNRNRAAIAQAEGERAIFREEVIQEWKALVYEYVMMKEQYEKMKEMGRTIFQNAIDAEEAMKISKVLFREGEQGVMDYVDTVQRSVVAIFNHLDAVEALEEIAIRLRMIVEGVKEK